MSDPGSHPPAGGPASSASSSGANSAAHSAAELPGDFAVRAAMSRWIETVVIGLKLCPFAAEPWNAGGVRIAVCHATGTDDAVRAALDEAFALLESDVRTTLVVYPEPGVLAEFETFLDVAETVDQILGEAGASGVLQVAPFHPDYRFGDEPDPDALGHYTNRAPYPVLHLLREEDVSLAVDAYPDIDQLPHDNVARLEALGRAHVVALYAGLREPE